MKKTILILITIVGIHSHTQAQIRLNAGIGYYGENGSNPGFVLEFEYEKLHGDDFSLPLRGDLGYHSTPDYNALIIDLHKGFRKYFGSGLFLEQSVGVGVIAKNYKTEMWFIDDYTYSIPHGNGTVLGFMPSVSAGLGYDLSKNKETSDLIWVRPKLYWDLGFRSLHLPYAALQIGYTHTLKTK
ncbi:MAG: hypothetical protein GY790_06350 [Bacteroidetes bacterium]|nr:hypothetical protein [Bacteroidota bacterium]